MGEKYVIQEVSTDREWLFMTGQLKGSRLTAEDEANLKIAAPALTIVKSNQLLLVDIYNKWSGPCYAVEGYLRRLRHSFVDAPNTLALARACCDNIEELEAFKCDIRPTFLFWARGRPVALLRGANRPLLTRLIEQEVEMEAQNLPRPFELEIDMYSPKVIQCAGELAELDDNDAIRSIGQGKTERLSLVFNMGSSVDDDSNEEDNLEDNTGIDDIGDDEEGDVEIDCENDSAVGPPSAVVQSAEDADAADLEAQLLRESSEVEAEEDGGDQSCQSDDDDDEDMELDPQPPTSALPAQEGSGVGGISDPKTDRPFGRKKVKSRKKMETGLLKEILDFKPSRRTH